MRKRSIFLIPTAVICLVFSASLATATVLDLTTLDASGSINGAIFDQFSDGHGAGTGNFDTFLVIQNRGIESGYNTDGSPLPLDAKEPAHTNALPLSNVPIVSRDGTDYRQFSLDIDQVLSGNNRYLSLDQLMISLHSTPDLTGSVSSVFANPLYNMDAGTDSWIKLNAALSSGLGQGDMLALIPNSLFSNPSGQYVYLYSKLGEHYAANNGPEQWGTLGGGVVPPVIPAPAALLLAGMGSALVGLVRRRRWL